MINLANLDVEIMDLEKRVMRAISKGQRTTARRLRCELAFAYGARYALSRRQSAPT